MSDVYLGQIMMFGGGYAPKGFAFCNGQLLSIPQNSALFSLLGTTYGGNGIQNFALPNLQSNLSVHQGTGPGLSPYQLGQVGGAATVTITQSTTPAHGHTLNATQTLATDIKIGATVVPAQPTGPNASPLFYAAPVQGQPPLVPQNFATAACSNMGSSQAHTNLMPSLCITFVIALQGIFPSRN